MAHVLFLVVLTISNSDSFRAPIRHSLPLRRVKVSLFTDYPDLEKCLRREYASFFNPMEKAFYEKNVSFIDPMTKFSGLENYMNNVNLLAGKGLLGNALFEDAAIMLHKIDQLEKFKIRTRWTLKLTCKVLPWKPRAEFTGVSQLFFSFY
jgi:hypothetical protein